MQKMGVFMKRLIALLAVICVAIGMLSGCGSSSGEVATTETNEVTKPKVSNPYNIGVINDEQDGSFHGNNLGLAPNSTYEIHAYTFDTDEEMKNVEFISSDESIVEVNGNIITTKETKNVPVEIICIYDGVEYNEVFITIT